jgi:branched-chain amino acid transport system ATP-binding protein
MLKTKKLTVQYGPLPALYEISLEVKQGEIVSLLGPNGAGKTTLLLTLSGILKTTEGRIIFEGEDITNLKPHQIVSKGIGHVPQGRHVFPTLSVIDNLMMGAYLHRNEKKEIKKELERIYQLLPALKERAHQRAGTLSGGEQQMLSIGRAMMGRPKLLLLDEPSLGLAPRLMEQFFATFGEMHQKGLTLLIVEQEIQLSLSISDRGYLLRNGRLIKEGSALTMMESRDVKALYLGDEVAESSSPLLRPWIDHGNSRGGD